MFDIFNGLEAFGGGAASAAAASPSATTTTTQNQQQFDDINETEAVDIEGNAVRRGGGGDVIAGSKSGAYESSDAKTARLKKLLDDLDDVVELQKPKEEKPKLDATQLKAKLFLLLKK